MLRSLKTKDHLRRKAGEIYGVIVTQARQPDFYVSMGVPDTPVGRYEMIVLHLFMVLERLREQGDSEGDGGLAQAVMETFVIDMDDCMREMGVGDVSVGRKVRRAAAGFYERGRDYREALATPDRQLLAQRLASHILVRDTVDPQSTALADYVRAAVVGSGDVAGSQAFPDLAPYAEAAR